MATLVLQVAGAYLGGPIGAAIGTFIGSQIDAQLFATTTKSQGPRLSSLTVQASTEGAPIPEIAGGVRLAGQIIWATNYKEVPTTQKQGGKGTGATTTETTTYAYYGNFAVGLCEGVIDRIGRIWADGKPLDQTGVTLRVYRGTADQLPDSLIEGVQGTGQAPAYRGTAYVVFDHFALAPFGNRIPQLTFEVFRKVGTQASLEDLITAVSVIPGAGERVYDTVIQRRYVSVTQTAPENNATGKPEADFGVAMDDLQASLPHVDTVFLVVGWFGSDLRAGNCTIRPKVEVTAKNTAPDVWRVHGIDRGSAAVVSQVNGRPAYGGTPSDDSLVRAVRDLHARGLSVFLYPFLFMDVPSDNALPNPYGGASQPAFPWRGRITCSPAPGVSGTPDKTAAAGTQVAGFFGAATPGQVSVSVDAGSSQVSVGYSGPSEWSYRRFLLHYAKLAAAINGVAPGAVSGIMIGSEVRGLCQVRDGAASFPAVRALKTLADDVKGIVGSSVKVSYGADWSDYNGYKPADSSGDFFFHLDPLWAASSIDLVGIDNYVPLSDWRDGTGHRDAAVAKSIYDPAYLASNIEGGEDYDWYYASQAARDAQTRSPISDGAYGKPWMFRSKDFRGWWSNQHFDRPGGVQSATPTAWAAQSKPIWFTEWGVPSVDRGTNQPNVFYDPKSSESEFPYYSRGTRDDLIQRRGHEAMLSYWADPTKNPTSTVYGGPMIGKISVWTWDARPFPAWPSRTDLWSDGGQWPFGHWIKGKIGFGDLAALVAERCGRVGFTDVDVSQLVGVVSGYTRDQPMSPRAEIELLMQAFAFDAVESEELIRFVPRGGQPIATFDLDHLLGDAANEPLKLTRAQETDLPNTVTITFTDVAKEYQPGSVSSQRLAGYSGRTANTALALVMDSDQAQQIADRNLAEPWIGRESGQFSLPPSALAYEPCDVVNLVVGGQARPFRLGKITDAWTRAVEAVRAEGSLYGPILPGPAPPASVVPPVYGPAVLRIMDLPILSDADAPYAPYVAASAQPWAGVTVLDSPTGADFALDTSLPIEGTLGETLAALNSGPLYRWDDGNVLRVQLYSGALASKSEAAVLSGQNAVALQNPAGDWEIVQFVSAALVGSGVYELRQLLRGCMGTEDAMWSPLPVAAPVVLLDGAVKQLGVTLSERGSARFYRWGSSRLPSTDPSWRQATFTPRAVGLLPWRPVHLTGARNRAGDLSISWIRQTRLDGYWNGDSTTDVPLNEQAEAYEVDILNGANVVRTLSSGAPAATYTAAQQAADFGGAQPSLTVVVYQLSATVGRGRPATATL